MSGVIQNKRTAGWYHLYAKKNMDAAEHAKQAPNPTWLACIDNNNGKKQKHDNWASIAHEWRYSGGERTLVSNGSMDF